MEDQRSRPVLPWIRLAVVAVLLVLLWYQWVHGTLGWDRFFIYSALVVFVALALGAIRQNASLFLQIARSEPGALSATLRRAAWLWSPMLLFLAAGLWLSAALSNHLTAQIYELTPIDRYCTASSSPDRPFPCDEMSLDLAAHDAHAARKPTLDALALHAQRRFDLGHVNLVAAVEATPDDAWAAENVAATVARLRPYFDAVEIMGWKRELKATVLPGSIEANRIVELERRVESIPAPPPEVLRLLGALDFNHPWLAGEKQRRVYKTEINGLRDQLKSHLDAAFADRVARQALLRARVMTRVAAVRLAERDAVAATADAGDANSRRAALLGAVLGRYDGMRQQIAAGVSSELARHAAAIAERGLPPTAGSDLDAAFADIRELYCSVERDSQATFVDDQQLVAARVNSAVFDCRALPRAGQGDSLEPKSLRNSIHLSIAAWREARIASLQRQVRQSLAAVLTGSQAGQAGALTLANQVPRRIALGRESCNAWFYPPTNCLKNHLKGRLEAQYEQARQRADAEYARQVANAAARSRTGGFEQVVEAAPEAMALIDDTARGLHRQVENAAGLAVGLAVLLNLLLAIAVLKSMLYVLAQVVFDVTGPAHVVMRGPGTAQGHYARGASFKLDGFSGRLLSKSVQDNQDKRGIFFWSPLTAVLARLRHGWYWHINAGGAAPGSSIVVHAPPGQEIINWDLAEGEEVYFLYRNLFGLSENVRLHSTFSLHLSTILWGRFILHCAQATGGPGKLLLAVDGSSETRQELIQTTDPHRLVAWSKNSRFRVSSTPLDHWSVLIHGFTFARVLDADGVATGSIVVETNDRRMGAARRLWRHARAMLSPF